MSFVLNPFTGNFDAVSDPFFEPFSFAANCQASDQVNQLVYVVADSVSGIPQVARIDVSDPNKMPAVGIILAKATSTTCTVAFFGVVVLSGLQPNKRYYADTTAFLTSSIPSARPVIVQVLGQAIDSSRLLFTPSKDLIRLNP